MSASFPTRNEKGEAVISEPLYHYTSVSSLKCIVETGIFQATHAFYMSDASEIAYGISRIRQVAKTHVLADETEAKQILGQMDRWLQRLLSEPKQIFVMCLSARDDDLNQWRSYAPRSGGACLVFDPRKLFACARAQGWEWSNCKYEDRDQVEWANRAVELLMDQARLVGPTTDAPPDEAYWAAFQTEVDNVLRIACRLKDEKFAEEWEWRLISPYMERFDDNRIGYRASGHSMLVPYARFCLGELQASGLIKQIVVGPTAHMDLSMNSIATFLSPRISSSIVRRSSVPYRVLAPG